MAALRFYPGRAGLASSLELVKGEIESLATSARDAGAGVVLQSGAALLEAEREHRNLGVRLADLLAARDVVVAHLDEAFVRERVAAAMARYRDAGCLHPEYEGWRRTSLLFSGGLRVSLWTPYVRPTRKGMVGRPRGSGKRRGAGAGCYPVLAALGIAERITPLTRSEVAREVVLCSSYSEAQEQLERAGLKIDIDTLTSITVRTGAAALAVRDEVLREAREAPLPNSSMVAGRRIRVSLDGGRARTRHTNRRARKKKNGRRPFTLQWREPRVMTIDLLNDEGAPDRSWRTLYEITLGGADKTFALLTGLLRLIGAHQAAQVVFVSDGADWIWNRVERLVEEAELPKGRVWLVLDYYHATEHIADALKACRNLGVKKRTKLLNQLCRALLEDDGAQKVIDRLRPLARGRRGPKVTKEIRYLEGHLEDMRYAQLRREKLPIGSGVVESAVRRVINLRFKSASMCWREDHLEALMYLRAILKSGHWEDLIRAGIEHRHWLTNDDMPPPPTTPEGGATYAAAA